MIPFALVGYEIGYSQLSPMGHVGYLPSHIQHALMFKGKQCVRRRSKLVNRLTGVQIIHSRQSKHTILIQRKTCVGIKGAEAIKSATSIKASASLHF